MPPTRFGRSLMGWVVIFVLILLLVMFLRDGFTQGREISILEFWNYVEDANEPLEGQIIIEPNRIRGQNSKNVKLLPKEPRKFYVVYAYQSDENFTKRLEAAKDNNLIQVQPKFEEPSIWEALLPHLLLTALVIGAIWFLLFRRMGAMGGGGGILGNFGRSRHRVTSREQSKITFDDVAGIDEAKDEVGEIIEFLRNPKKFQRLGGRIPRGVLLVGSPGCGKTLLAKAIAGEADVPFFSISGSDFVEMFVGVGASRVRDLFKQAKDNSPCIIFLDEIDAVGRRRGASYGAGGGHDEREQTLNAILVEMDGFESSDQVIVIAATNRLDVLDPALTRPGRFDRQINVPLPDVEGRLKILSIYADKIKCADDIDLKRVARGTPMFSGADLAALVNEAAIMATMSNKDFVEMVDFEEARDKVRWGRARKSRVIDEKEQEITAYHEAGHALVQFLDPDADPLHKVSIIPRGPMGGATFSLPEKDRHYYSRNYCKAFLRVAFGGRVAEEIFCHDISSGAAQDIAQATSMARTMAIDWGMSERLGPIAYANSRKEELMPEWATRHYSDKTAEAIDQEVKVLIDTAHKETRMMIEANRDKLERLAKALLKYETLSNEDVEALFEGKTLDKPTVGELLEAEQQKINNVEETEENQPETDQDKAEDTES